MAALPETIPAGTIELRRWRVDNLEESMTAIRMSIDDLCNWMPWAVGGMPSPEAQREFLRRGEVSFEDGADFGYLLREVHSGELVGGCGCHRRIGPGAVEVGYWVRSDKHRRGYATAAAGALTAAAFTHLAEIERVEIHIDTANEASKGVPLKLGFVFDRTENRERLTPAQSGAWLVFVMTRDAWRPQ
jgi:RimJ/RimL family protein N-acetyltransferase